MTRIRIEPLGLGFGFKKKDVAPLPIPAALLIINRQTKLAGYSELLMIPLTKLVFLCFKNDNYQINHQL